MVDEYMDVWMRINGIPAIAWHSNFFVSLAKKWVSFTCIDEKTPEGKVLDIARILLKVPLHFRFPNSVNFNIDGCIFKLMIREDAMGQFLLSAGKSNSISSDNASSDSDDISCDVSLEEDVDFRTICSKDSIRQFSSPVDIYDKGTNNCNFVSEDGNDNESSLESMMDDCSANVSQKLCSDDGGLFTYGMSQSVSHEGMEEREIEISSIVKET